MFAQEPFSLGEGGETDVAVQRYTPTTGVACYLGADIPTFGRRGRCTLIEGGAASGEELIALSDKPLYNAMGRMSDSTDIWCYADAENGLELKCRKLNLVNGSLEKEYELTIKDHSVHFGSTIISVAGFSHQFAVVCYELPASGQSVSGNPGTMACGLLYITEGTQWAGNLDINSVYGIQRHPNISSARGISVTSLSSDSGMVCFGDRRPDGSGVSCTTLSLALAPGVPFATTAQMALNYGSSVAVGSGDAQAVAVAALSSVQALVCYSTGEAGACALLTSAASTPTKGDEAVFADGPVSDISIQAFGGTMAVVCYRRSSTAACQALDADGGQLTVGVADEELTVDDAAADTKLAVASLSGSEGLLCYTSSSNAGVCRELEVTQISTTPHTTTASTTTSSEHTTTDSTTTDSTTTHTSSTTASATSSATSSTSTSFATTTVATTTDSTTDARGAAASTSGGEQGVSASSTKAATSAAPEAPAAGGATTAADKPFDAESDSACEVASTSACAAAAAVAVLLLAR